VVTFFNIFFLNIGSLDIFWAPAPTQKTDGQPTKTFIIFSIFMILPSNKLHYA